MPLLDSLVFCVAYMLRQSSANPGEYLLVPPCRRVFWRSRTVLAPLLAGLEIVALASMSYTDSGCEGNDSSHRCGGSHWRLEHVAHLSHGREVQWVTRVVLVDRKVVELTIGGVGHGRILAMLLFEIVASVSNVGCVCKCLTVVVTFAWAGCRPLGACKAGGFMD
jgi:hypothetical protein